MSLPIATLYLSFCRKRRMRRAVFLAVDPAGTVLPLHMYDTSKPEPVSSAALQGPVSLQASLFCTMWLVIAHSGVPVTVPASTELSVQCPD